MAGFSSWTALHAAMLDRFADYVAGESFRTLEYSIDTGATRRTFQFRTLDEFQKALAWAKNMADMESGAAVGRTYAKNGGRG